MKRRALLLMAVLAAVCCWGVLAAAAPAQALNIPGSDCLNPPDPTYPDGGVSGWIDPGPAHPVGGNPFSGKPNAPSIYDVYGYGGTRVVSYDPQTIGPTCVSIDATHLLIDWTMGAASVTVAVAVRFYRAITDPGFGSIFDPIQHAAQNVLGRGLFLPLAGVVVTVVGLWILWRASKDQPGTTARRVGKLALVLGVGIACTIYPLTIGQANDKALGQVVSTTAGLAIGNNSRHSPADALAGAVQASVLYNTWAQATFGPGAIGDAAAKEFGPRLFAASTYSRAEAAQNRANPAGVQALADAKKGDYKTVAGEVQVKYPEAYRYVKGDMSGTQFGFVLVGFVGAVLAVGFLIYALFKLAYSMIIVRVAVGAAAALALIAMWPKHQHFADAMVRTVGKAFVTAAYFGAGAVIFTVAGVGGIMSPSTHLPPIVKMLAMGLLSWALWKGAKEFHLTSLKTRQEQDERDRRGEMPDDTSPAPVAPEPAYTFAAESQMRTRTVPAMAQLGRSAVGGMIGGGMVAATGGAAAPAVAGAAARKGVTAGVTSAARQIGPAPVRPRIYHPSDATAKPAAPLKPVKANHAGVYKIHSLGG